MHHTCVVCVLQRVEQRRVEPRGLYDGDGPALAKVCGQGPAIDVLHDDRRQPVPVDNVVDTDDTRTIQPGRHPRFAFDSSDQPDPRLGHGSVRRREKLDRHDPVELLFASLPNRAHRALADLADGPVMSADQITVRALRHAVTLRGGRTIVRRNHKPASPGYCP